MIKQESFLIFVSILLLSKKTMQKIILSLLAFFASSIIRWHKPMIIGITGTVGKTTVTAHVHTYLARMMPTEAIWYSPDHYNGEYGLPLTIIGAKTGGKNPLKWIWVFVIAISQFFRSYPRYLVLEYGIDHPGEMDFLLSIAIPDVVIITEIAPNHIEQFGTFDLYKKEKLKIITHARELIIHDSLRNLVEREAIYYGTGAMSEIDVSHIEITPTGTQARVHFAHRDYDVSVRAFGGFHIVNLLPLYALSEIYGLSADGVALYARLAHGEPGRSSILEWVGWSTIIDGSYNWGYLALHAGIASMRSFSTSYVLVFILGDMRELGNETESLHKRLAEEIVELLPHKSENIQFFLVWPYMREHVLPILDKRFTVTSSLSSREVGHGVKKILSKASQKSSIVYVKWSQNTIFLEEAIEVLLKNPSDTIKLCRQSPEWKRKKEEFFKSL
jgi:UDP-N-acetylmuramoyl-tripeptide--D-alanyl-D-alanine ligase